ncbi:SHOCT domain-containing protein [Methylotenera versatilis]|uniref:SHOCT domain-containing protein n=1 Tax=Methylotenera versatilis TaxID=1055487 RepID=UPI0006472B32|nr:SHOCT domain-containing protein [Methylotenera versatilis]
MTNENINNELAALEKDIGQLEQRITLAKSSIQECVDANSALSLSAAEARAKNQGSGRGLLGAFLGSKYRGVMRSAAAASNASISKEVAQKRSKIAELKLERQSHLKHLQEQLKQLKSELKQKVSKSKSNENLESKNKASSSLDLLMKLKKAHESGLLTDSEFEEKRKKLVSVL